MKRKSILRIICINALIAVFSASITACGNRMNDSNESKATTAANSDSSVPDADTTTEESSAAETTVSEDTGSVTEAVEPVIADLSFLNGSPNNVEVSARKIKIEATESSDKNSTYYDIDIIDKGASYLLGVEKIKYYFGVSPIYYRTSFIENAIDENKFTDVDGKRDYAIIEGSNILTCCGEEFTLVSYTQNDMGRGTCEFIGSDGDKYFLYNDISSYLDNFTGEMFFKIVTEDGQPAFKELTFDEGTYLEIPRDKAESAGIKNFAANSPDNISGNQTEYYLMQLGADGNIMKIQGQ